MIPLDLINKLRQAQPFRSFSIIMADGSRYDITDPALCELGEDYLTLRLRPVGRAIPAVRYCSLHHITEVFCPSTSLPPDAGGIAEMIHDARFPDA